MPTPLTPQNAKVGMKVEINPEKIGDYAGSFTEGVKYEIEAIAGNCVRIRDNVGHMRAMFFKRFFIYEGEAVKFNIGDYVARPNGVAGFVEKVYPSGCIKLKDKVGRFTTKDFVKTDVPLVPKKDGIDYSLLNKLKGVAGGGVCSYIVKPVNGEAVIKKAGHCHAELGRYGVLVKGPIEAIGLNVSAYVPEGMEKEYKRYVEYIVKDSPWSKYFIQDSVDNIINNGVYLDVNNPHSYVVAAAIALRVGSEHNPSHNLKLFQTVLDQGFSGHVAFLVSQTMSVNGGELQPRDQQGWHHVISTDHKMEDLVQFFKEGYRPSNEKYTTKGLKMYAIQEHIGGENGGYIKAVKECAIMKRQAAGFGAKNYFIPGPYEVAVAKVSTFLSMQF